MTKSHHLWSKAARLLSDPKFFDSERERVLADYPLLNSQGLGQGRRRRHISGSLGDGTYSCLIWMRREMSCGQAGGMREASVTL